jgi:CBS domain-containing protein
MDTEWGADRGEWRDAVPPEVPRVREVMRPDAHPVLESTTTAAVLRIMIQHRLQHVPVVDGRGRVLGTAHVVEVLSQALAAPGQPVGAVMTRPAVTVRPGTAVPVAARVAARHGLALLYVTGPDGELLGTFRPADARRIGASTGARTGAPRRPDPSGTEKKDKEREPWPIR